MYYFCSIICCIDHKLYYHVFRHLIWALVQDPASLLPIQLSSMTWKSIRRWHNCLGLCPYMEDSLDVAEDQQITDAISMLKEHWDGLDGLVHAIGFAPREAIAGDFLEGLSREAFAIAHDISAYSFPALVKEALPMLEGRNSSVLTLTYLGAEKAVPNYNTMGVAKAALEASVRYLAASLGPKGIRANGISAGPIKTLAASGIKDFGKILRFVEQNAPLRRNVTIEDVGNVAAFMMSDLAAGITGEITHVDAGFNCVTPGMHE